MSDSLQKHYIKQMGDAKIKWKKLIQKEEFVLPGNISAKSSNCNSTLRLSIWTIEQIKPSTTQINLTHKSSVYAIYKTNFIQNYKKLTSSSMKTFSREFDSEDTTQLRVHHQITKHHNLIKRYYYEPSKLLKKNIRIQINNIRCWMKQIGNKMKLKKQTVNTI